jgi:hypothetical protein
MALDFSQEAVHRAHRAQIPAFVEQHGVDAVRGLVDEAPRIQYLQHPLALGLAQGQRGAGAHARPQQIVSVGLIAVALLSETGQLSALCGVDARYADPAVHAADDALRAMQWDQFH